MGGRHRPLRIEALEARLALTTANLAAVGAYLTNSSGQMLTSLNSGEVVWVAVEFTTQNLPSNAKYGVNCTFNGVTVSSGDTITAGAGSRRTQEWTLTGFGAFIATPGTNQVIIVVDPDQSVAETTYADNTLSGSFTAASPQVSGSVYSYSPAQIRAAYGIGSIPNFGSAPADGTGQTIAIVDPYNDPTVLADLDSFDQVMCVSTTSTETLYQQYGPASSFLTVYNESGTNITADVGTSGSNGVPPADPTGEAEGEESLDVQWAHAVAPGAKIDLIECDSFNDIFLGEATAAGLPGVTVVSNSWGGPEASDETSYDSYFTTPADHTGVTFLAAAGDSGAPAGYPASSPNVVAVGGTQLTLNNNAYDSETGWNFSTPRTLDNGSSSYSQTGSWSSQSGGFSGAYSSAAAGSPGSATWTTSISSSDEGGDGGVEVSATWVAAAGNATNATYEIYDGTAATGTLLGTATVDQTQSPVGISDGSLQFQGLGVYYPQSGTLTVVLSAASANGTVAADAVGIVADWAGSGGQSQVEPEPSYQLAVQDSGFRTTPDVSFDASGSSGVFICDNGSFDYDVGGTSLASPSWAGLIAIVNQGLVANGGTTLNSGGNPTQTLQDLYSLPAADYHDITSGYNGLSAGPGYDEVTGLGSPIANVLVPDLVSFVPLSLSRSSVAVGPPDILPGDTTTVTLTAKEADGSQEASGGLHVAFSVGAGSTGSGTFGAVVDNGNGTYSATFTGTTAGGISIAAAVDGHSVTSTAPALIVLAPAVTAISTSEMAGVYPAGTVIPITLTFNEPVTVSGTPQLALNAGGGATASYSGGSGTSALTFSYTVGAGQNSSDLDYASIAALGLNGGSLQDANGNAAVLTLPDTGSDGLAMKDIVIDTATLTVTAADWTSAGLTLLLDASGNVHVYTTGTTTDVVAPLPLATLTNIEITSPGGSAYQLTIDSTNGDPVPAGGLTYNGGGGLVKIGSGAVPLSATNIYTGGTTVWSGTLWINAADALPNDGGLTVGAGGTVIIDPPSSAGPIDTTIVSDATSATTSSDAGATSSVPVTANEASPSLVLSAPTSTVAPASSVVVTPPSVSATFAPAMPVVQASAEVEAWPIGSSHLTLSQVANNSPAGEYLLAPIPPSVVSAPRNVTHRTVAPALLPPARSVPAAASRTPAVDQVIGVSATRSAAGDLTWLEQAANDSDDSDQQRKKEAAILALDALFARYGQ
jgi:autotransporter-associated beta strand protein